jgi:poly(ADP-ribose) glycohydrolase
VYSKGTYGGIDYEDWLKMDTFTLSYLEVNNQKKISDYYEAMQVVFSNKYIGGNVLSDGCTQEEIMLSTNPESLISLLIFEKLGDKEAVIIKGAKPSAETSGFNLSFKYERTYNNFNKLKGNTICLIDALNYTNDDSKEQYKLSNIMRELNKAFIGFAGEMLIDSVSTGKWGCGVQCGNPQLKLVLQWIAATRAGKKINFCSLGEGCLQKAYKIVDRFKGKALTELLLMVEIWVGDWKNNGELFEFLLNSF